MPRSRTKPTKPEMPTLQVVRVELDALQIDLTNANEHDDENINSIKASLEAWGQVEPLIVQTSTGRIIGGNGRLAAMYELGWTHCDVSFQDVTDDEAEALSIALSHTAQTSRLNEHRLAETMTRLRARQFEVGKFGFTENQLGSLIERLRATQPSAFPRPAPSGAGEATTDGEATPEPGRPMAAYPLAITLTRPQYNAWKAKKAELNVVSDTLAFLRLIELED